MPIPDWLTLPWQFIRPYGRYAYYTLFPQRRPAYFNEPWTYPPASPDSSPTVFFLPMTDWHARLQRSSHLARSVAATGAQAVYVNPHLGLEYRLPYAFDPHARAAALGPRLFEFHVHLPREHELHRRPLTVAESCRIVREIAGLIDRSSIREAALVVSFPAWLEAAAELRRRYGFPILYDCHDWLPGFGRTAPALLQAEEALFQTADTVIFSSQFLQNRVLERHDVRSKSILIRNAAGPLPAPAEPRRDHSHTVGYVGALDHWFDIDAVAAVASAHPEWRVVLAGRVEDPRVLRLQSHSNVTFAGEIPPAGLAALLHGWDAAMIPFLVNDLTRAANPIKLYEYFGAGLPVVSTRLPEVELYADLVYLADSPSEFAVKAAAAMDERTPERRQSRIAAAGRETWDIRAQQLLDRVRALAPRAPA
jgi:glycosyltransferase involved in cell wall biosynthesis